MKGGWVYIMTNRPNGTLYIGVTNDIARRTYEHRSSIIPGFTKRYRLHHLVHFEWHDDIRSAIQTRLITQTNPEWRDLYPDLF